MKIIHRCKDCGHPEEYHPHIGKRTCDTPKDVIKQQPSELVPTIDGAGRIQETVTKPGTIWPGGHPKITTCDCQPCQNLYDETIGGDTS